MDAHELEIETECNTFLTVNIQCSKDEHNGNGAIYYILINNHDNSMLKPHHNAILIYVLV